MISFKSQEKAADRMNDPNRKLWIRKLERRLWIIYFTIITWWIRIKFKLGYGKIYTFAEWKKELKLDNDSDGK